MLELQYSLWNSCALPSEKKNLITYFCEPWLKDHPAIRKGLLGMGMMHSHSSRTSNVKILDMCIYPLPLSNFSSGHTFSLL